MTECEIKTVYVKLVGNKTKSENCSECGDKGFYTVQNVYTGAHEVPCDFCEKGMEVLKDLFPEVVGEKANESTH